MYFDMIYEQDGTVAGVALRGDWEFDASWSKELLRTADPSFLERVDNLLIVKTIRNVATYEITGETPEHVETTLVRLELAAR